MTDIAITSYWLNLQTGYNASYPYLYKIAGVARGSIRSNPFSGDVAVLSSGLENRLCTEFVSIHRFNLNGLQFCPGIGRHIDSSVSLGIYIYSEKRMTFRSLKTIAATDENRVNLHGVHRITDQYASRFTSDDEVAKKCKMMNLQNRNELLGFYNANMDNALFITKQANIFEQQWGLNYATYLLNTKTLELVEL